MSLRHLLYPLLVFANSTPLNLDKIGLSEDLVANSAFNEIPASLTKCPSIHTGPCAHAEAAAGVCAFHVVQENGSGLPTAKCASDAEVSLPALGPLAALLPSGSDSYVLQTTLDGEVALLFHDASGETVFLQLGQLKDVPGLVKTGIDSLVARLGLAGFTPEQSIAQAETFYNNVLQEGVLITNARPTLHAEHKWLEELLANNTVIPSDPISKLIELASKIVVQTFFSS